MSITNQNERSQAIDLISEINLFLSNVNLAIKKAGGETTIKNNRTINGQTRKIMFPDILLYSDDTKTEIIQGWELKLPDVPITDETFIRDAQYKADALGLKSTVLWNFQSVVLYVKENDNWKILKRWDDLNSLFDRNEVSSNSQVWKDFLQTFLTELNDYLINGTIEERQLSEITDQVIVSIIQDNKIKVSNMIREESQSDRRIDAFIKKWWSDAKNDFLNDESDYYQAYSKIILLGWLTRIIFAHSIKDFHNAARIISDIDETISPNLLNNIFSEITTASDFYTVFESKEYDTLIPDSSWANIIEFNSFLNDKVVSHSILQSILEDSVKRYKREVNGQFTTPEKLAQLLVEVTMLSVRGHAIDPCCGTGIIPKKIIELKESMGLRENDSHETTWASDKMQFPLQIANMTLTTPTSMEILNKVFKKNVFDLVFDDEIKFRSPSNGEIINQTIPKFINIISNLPFVQFESIDENDRSSISAIRETLSNDSQNSIILSNRSDYYSYIPLKLYSLLDEKGRIGVIISNSWLGTEAGQKWYKALLVYYKIKTIIISGKGRWFHNADVVTCILIMEKKNIMTDNYENTKFIVLNEKIDLISSETISDISDSILNNIQNDYYTCVEYSEKEIDSFLSKNLSLNSIFFDIHWIQNIYPKLSKITDYFKVIRGMRRGWDPLFILPNETDVEEEYIEPILKSSRSITTRVVSPDKKAFCCSKTQQELRNLNHNNTLAWINTFEHSVNGRGRPLTEVLASSNLMWYEMKSEGSIAEFVTSIAPNKRLFWAVLSSPSFINQRLIGLNRKELAYNFPKELFSALLNSIISLFFIEASGFGRGLGALDINKNNLEKTFILNPERLTEEQIQNIINKYNELPATISEDLRIELETVERINFDKYVLECFELDEYYESIKNSLVQMMTVRLSSKDN